MSRFSWLYFEENKNFLHSYSKLFSMRMGWFFYGPSVKQSKRRIIMNFMRRQIFATAMAAVTALGSSAAVSAADTKYNLLPNKPFDLSLIHI